MSFTWLTVLLTCIGGVLSCMTSEKCKGIHDESSAALSANNLKGYCELRSKSIACYAADTAGCPEPNQNLDTMYTDYYSTCSVTSAQVESCKQQTVTCGTMLEGAMDALSSMNISGFCSEMQPYLNCVKNGMTSCSSNVTIYDVIGSLHLTYDQFCSTANGNDKQQICQGIIARAGCQNSLMQMSDALTGGDTATYCSLYTAYQTCFDNAFATCDPSLNKDSFKTPGMEQSFQQICGGSPSNMCKQKTFSCYPTLAAFMNNTMGDSFNPAAMCEGMKNYFACLDEVMKTCDASVKRSDIVGPMEASYNMTCGGGAGVYCPAIGTCLQPMVSMTAETTTPAPTDVPGEVPYMMPSIPNIMQGCGKVSELMTCMDTALGNCGATPIRSYGLKDIAGLFTSSCKLMGSNPDLLTCKQMDTCMKTMNVPSDIKAMSKLYYDPQFWCAQIKSVMTCAESSSQCSIQHSDFTKLLGEVNQICPEAKVMVQVSGNPGGDAHILRAGMLTVFSALLLVLITGQL